MAIKVQAIAIAAATTVDLFDEMELSAGEYEFRFQGGGSCILVENEGTVGIDISANTAPLLSRGETAVYVRNPGASATTLTVMAVPVPEPA